MRHFTHVLTRIAGGPISEFKELELPDTFLSIQKLHEYEIEANEIKNEICNSLFILAKACDERARSILINNKRKIFNRKQWNFEGIELPSALHTKIRCFEDILRKINKSKEDVQKNYELEFEASQKKLRSLSNNDILLNGLVLSSQTLLKEVLKGQDSQAKQSKRWEGTEDGLIKYMSRMYCKTSPFSTFTNLEFATLSDEHFDGILRTKNDGIKNIAKSHVRVNNSVLDWILSIIKDYGPIQHQLTIRLNPTIKHSESFYRFLINRSNVETFQEVNRNPAIEAVESVINQYSTNSLKWRELCLCLEKNYLDTDLDTINEYINNLIGIGFLEYSIGVSGLGDSWNEELTLKLLSLDATPLGDEIISALMEIRDIAKRYELAEPETRLSLMGDAYSKLRSTASFADSCIHEYAGISSTASKINVAFPYKPEQIFFEDTTINLDISISRSIREHLDVCFNLAESKTIFDGNFDEREKMLSYFVDKYPDAEIDVLSFYETYYRDVKVPLLKAKILAETPTGLEDIDGLRKRNDKFRKWCESFHLKALKGTNNGVVHIGLDEIKATNKELGFEPTERRRSFGFITQCFQENGNDYLVLTGISAGYGKWFSRFLHLFSSQITDALRHLNSQVDEEALLLENCDASFFNANMHPPLLPLEVVVPNANHSLSSESQIPVTDLKIRLNKVLNRLELIHVQTGKQVYVVDFGFLSLKRRSELFQLLESFTFIENVAFFSVLNSVNGVASVRSRNQGLDYEYHPRVLLDNKVIIQRRTWLFEKSMLPIKKPNEANWEYFCRINLWRLEHNLPEEVFIYVHEREGNGRSNQISRDDYKPQYISFSNAYLLKLLGQLMRKVPVRLKIVEMLPNSSQLLSIKDQKYVAEFIFKSYNY